MASMVAKPCSSSTSQVFAQEKGSRNKRKFRADPPLGDINRNITVPHDVCSSYEFSAEKFGVSQSHGHPNGCDVCSVSQDHSDALKLDLGLSTAVGSSEVGPIRCREETEAGDELHDADWSDLTESQLEELVLNNLDMIFKGAIKKIIDCGYTEEVATKAVLRSGFCYGCKDIVSNMVDNTLAFLRTGQEIDPSRAHYFEDLQQMEKYVLAELVCVLREVRPFFSMGDAMWCLLISDMNVSHACAMDTDPFGSFVADAGPNTCNSVQPQSRSEAKTCKISSSIDCAHTCQCETAAMASMPFVHSSQSLFPTFSGVPNLVKPKSSVVPEKESPISTADTVDKSFVGGGTTQFHGHEEKFVGSRKISGITKREYILRQKFHMEKGYRTYGSKSRAGKISGFGGLMVDKKVKSVSVSTDVKVKNASQKTSKIVEVDATQDNGNHNLSTSLGLSSPVEFKTETVDSVSLPKTNTSSTLHTVVTPPALSASDTELSLSLPSKSNAEAPKSFGKWVPQDKKDEMFLKLVPRVQELQNQLQEWTEWANQKIKQATSRLIKDKAELKTLRQEKEEVERIKREKQTLEESTMKKLSEMEYALGKACGQVDRANSAVRRLEVENAALRVEMEAAKCGAAESAARCQDVLKTEKKTLTNVQSWEKQKTLFQEEIVAEKRKLAMLQQELEQAKEVRDQLEARWKREEKAKEELLTEASSIRKEREQIEDSAKSKEEAIKSKAEKTLHKYKDDIEKLEKVVSELRSKTDSSKIAALRRGIDGSYASTLKDIRNSPAPIISKIVPKFQEYSGVKRERECVMCLSEEMSVVFLPCAHQVVCTTCNELHEKQGMKDCPSCRSTIQRRICVRYYARS
ncbi:hypothetical protein RHSIM_Rhsim02G0016800 [Rhododendron simsii]|uniref:RING-type domain-containing protein n=1 Tax=Rhododendron simsii TaxID=118357 RepID=A0A834HFK9_RHOSS|nr:hypothetical protein RHSIM_Rhsim02G0016800 [Rhododendron simsii]